MNSFVFIKGSYWYWVISKVYWNWTDGIEYSLFGLLGCHANFRIPHQYMIGRALWLDWFCYPIEFCPIYSSLIGQTRMRVGSEDQWDRVWGLEVLVCLSQCKRHLSLHWKSLNWMLQQRTIVSKTHQLHKTYLWQINNRGREGSKEKFEGSNQIGHCYLMIL